MQIEFIILGILFITVMLFAYLDKKANNTDEPVVINITNKNLRDIYNKIDTATSVEELDKLANNLHKDFANTYNSESGYNLSKYLKELDFVTRVLVWRSRGLETIEKALKEVENDNNK